MRRTNCWCGFGPAVIVILSLVGCAKAPVTPAPATPSITSTSSTPPSAASTPNASSSTADTLSEDKPAPTKEMASAQNSPPPATEAATPESKPKPSTPEEKDLSTLSHEELVAGMVKTLQKAMQKANQRKVDEAYPLYIESGRYAEELLKSDSDLTGQERRICALAFYNQACGYSMNSDQVSAMAALKRAFDNGFDDFDNLDSDTDLVKVRELPDYASAREEWEKTSAEKKKAAIAQEMAEFESFPFDFTLPDLDDMPVKLADYAGKVVIVDIWGTWCPPCRAEVPSFVKLQSKYGDQGLQIIGLNYERSKDAETAVKGIRKFIEANSMNYPCLIGDTETQKQVPGFSGYPTTLFLDRSGKVRLQYVGAHPYGSLESVVVALLAEEAK